MLLFSKFLLVIYAVMLGFYNTVDSIKLEAPFYWNVYPVFRHNGIMDNTLGSHCSGPGFYTSGRPQVGELVVTCQCQIVLST